MASKFSNEEARAILERSRALLDDDSRPIAEPEPTREEILQAELARPVETHNERVRREIGEREARQARRETTTEQAMAALEARLIPNTAGSSPINANLFSRSWPRRSRRMTSKWSSIFASRMRKSFAS